MGAKVTVRGDFPDFRGGRREQGTVPRPRTVTTEGSDDSAGDPGREPRQAVPARGAPGAVPDAARGDRVGGGRAAAPMAPPFRKGFGGSDDLGVAPPVARSDARRGVGRHRPERGGQDHLAQTAGAHHRPDRGLRADARAAGQPVGGGDGLSPRVNRPGERLPQRCGGDSTRSWPLPKSSHSSTRPSNTIPAACTCVWRLRWLPTWSRRFW